MKKSRYFRMTVILAPLLLLVLSSPSAIGAELSPGTIITKDNADLVSDLVPEAVLKRLKTGEYIIKIGQISPASLASVYSKAFYEASESNKGKYKLDKRGGIVDESGKRPTLGPGYPFPALDTSDSEAGAKIMWNYAASEFQTVSQEVMFLLKTFKGYTVDVSVIARGARVSNDFRPGTTKAEGITYKELSIYLSPADIFGTVNLTWRWQDPTKWDSIWAYVPSLRRVRRVSAANRSDTVGATDYMTDDINGYAGKVEFFDWKLLKTGEMLLTYIPDSADSSTVTFPKAGEAIPRRGKKAFMQPRFKTTWGYQEEPRTHAAWWPTNVIWVKRPVFIVEGKSRDPYYSVGTQQLIIDRETYRIHMKLGWDRAGTYWRTQVMTQGYYVSPDKTVAAPAAEISCLIDEKQNRASTSDRTDAEVTPTIFNIDIDPQLFSISNFVNYGK